MPFIIRGVKLWGIDSVSVSIKRREFLWDEASKLVDFDLLDNANAYYSERYGWTLRKN